MFIGQTTSFVHFLVRQVVAPGETVVDATVGNGHDALFLAQTVGREGRVHGFDIQQAALDNALERLKAAGADECVTLHRCGHERMAQLLEDSLGMVGAIMFNLGYLPGSDGAIITKPETTLQAIDASLELLRPAGIATLVLYTGHPGGGEEGQAVRDHCAAIPTEVAQVMHCTMHNHADPKISILVLEKKKPRKQG